MRGCRAIITLLMAELRQEDAFALTGMGKRTTAFKITIDWFEWHEILFCQSPAKCEKRVVSSEGVT
jgi:hypothetical protein